MANITLRTIEHKDMELLFTIFASTRTEEMIVTGWDNKQINEFLLMQFNLQHTQYEQNYKNASLDIIMYDNKPAGRLYINRTVDDIRIIDISILPEFRHKGIGNYFLTELINESEQSNIQLSLHVEFNNPALQWYEKLGFKKIKEIGIYYYMKREPIRN